MPESEIEKFKKELGLNCISSLNDLKIKIENNYLCFDDYVKYELINPKNFEVKTQFTISQKEALWADIKEKIEYKRKKRNI